MRRRDVDAPADRLRLRGRPLARWALIGVLAQLSVRALVGGGALIAAPSGRIVGLSTDALGRTPFGDYLVPGILLFAGFGIGSAVVCYGLYAGVRRAPVGAVAVGAGLLAWLAVELLAGFERPTVWLNLATAVAVIGLGLSHSVRTARDQPAE